MESKKNPTGIATKWALIYLITSIVLTFAMQFAKVDQSTSPLRYLAYIPLIAFLFLAQKEYKDDLGGYITFGNAFSTGLRYAVFTGLLTGIFTYMYMAFLNPDMINKIVEVTETQMEAKGSSSADIEKATTMMRNYGSIFGAFGAAIWFTILGIILALIGAAILKKERSPFDNEGAADSFDPAV